MIGRGELPEIPATAWALLGVLSFGQDLSGYDIGRWAQSSLAFFYWTPSPSQVYAELRRLERLGLAEVVGPADDRRRKQLYRITSTGTAALREWLDTSEPGPTMLKHPTALRIWLGHLMEPERLRVLVARHRDELAASAEAASKAASVAAAREGWEYPALVTSWSERSYRSQAALMAELLDELDQLAATGRAGPGGAPSGAVERTDVHVAYTEEQERMRSELRTYYEALLDEETRAELHGGAGIGPAMRRVWKQMCADGWAGVGWPTEWGGQGRSAIEQFIFFDESMRAGAPVPMLTINTVGPTIMNFGSDEQKAEFLPRILAGEIHFCIGYSEPGAGTDLASLSTRAVRDGDEYVVNGQKMWTSLSSDADYCWLAVRTDPDVAKHKGISILIVPMDTPGITLSPLRLIGDHDINAVYLDDVRVPVANCVGGENNGWKLITNQLNHERVTLCSTGVVERAYEDVLAWARTARRPDGAAVIDDPWVRQNLARVHAGVEVLRLMNWQVAWEATQGVLDIGHCSAIKVYGTEMYLEAFRLLMELLGPQAYLQEGTPGAAAASRLESMARGMLILTFGGGTNELQRDLITMFSLGFPRGAR